MLRYAIVLLAFIFSSCGAYKTSSEHIFKARQGTNSPYSDDKENNKTLKEHDKKAQERQEEIDKVNNKNIDKEMLRKKKKS